jgi:hypothetical protein
MSREDFMTLPESMEVREVEISIEQKGFRPKKIILVTTLLDSKRYSKVKLAEMPFLLVVYCPPLKECGFILAIAFS